MCSPHQLTETHEQFGPPKIMKPKVTAHRRFEQFLWREFYDEYIRYNERQHVQAETSETEYKHEFCKNKTTENEQEKEKLHAEYPVYCTSAITLWNNDGDPNKDFKKRYSITRPVEEQYKQWS